jgi:hypothetical protein
MSYISLTLNKNYIGVFSQNYIIIHTIKIIIVELYTFSKRFTNQKKIISSFLSWVYRVIKKKIILV